MVNYLSKSGQTGEGAWCHLPVWSQTGPGLPRASNPQQPDCCLAVTHCLWSLWCSCLMKSFGGGIHTKHPWNQCYPHGRPWLIDLLLPTKKLFSAHHLHSTSQAQANAVTFISSLPVALSLWIFKHLVDYTTNYSFLFPSSMLSVLAPPVIHLFMPHSNQFSETVLMSKAIQGWLYWKINFKNCFSSLS